MPSLSVINPKDWAIKAAILIIAFNILDIYLTLLVLDRGGSEANPFAQFLIDSHLIIPLKIILPAGVLIGFIRVKPEKLSLLNIVTAWFVAGMYFCVVLTNLMVWWIRFN